MVAAVDQHDEDVTLVVRVDVIAVDDPHRVGQAYAMLAPKGGAGAVQKHPARLHKAADARGDHRRVARAHGHLHRADKIIARAAGGGAAGQRNVADVHPHGIGGCVLPVLCFGYPCKACNAHAFPSRNAV